MGNTPRVAPPLADDSLPDLAAGAVVVVRVHMLRHLVPADGAGHAPDDPAHGRADARRYGRPDGRAGKTPQVQSPRRRPRRSKALRIGSTIPDAAERTLAVHTSACVI